MLVDFPDDDCVRNVKFYIRYLLQVCSRAVLIKAVYRLWCEGNSWEELFSNLQMLPNAFTSFYYDVGLAFFIIKNHCVEIAKLEIQHRFV